MGVNSFRHAIKGSILLGWETAGWVAQAIEHPFKTVNANDNFANDNIEFAPVALAA